MISVVRGSLGLRALLGVLVACVLMVCATAPSAKAVECGNAALRIEQRATYLPDCRGYEQVSAPGKGFANVDSAIQYAVKVTIADDGSALAYCNASAGGALVPAAQYCGSYLARRNAGSWNTEVLAPAGCGQGQQELALTGDLDYALIAQPESASCGVAPLDPGAPLPGINLYRQSLKMSLPGFDLLTPALGFSSGTRNSNTRNGSLIAVSKSASTILYLSSGDQCRPVACGLTIDGTRQLFGWDAVSGAVRLVSRDPSNSLLTGASTIAGNPQPTYPRGAGYGGVSADGQRIYFQNPVDAGTGDCGTPSCELYLRKNGTTTVKASEQECSGGTSECPEDTAADVFKWADPSGTKAVFETTAKLVNEDPTTSASSSKDLYMYRDSTNPAAEKNLWLLSKDEEPGDGTGAGVDGVLGMSEDGDTVFFVAGGQLVAGGPTAAGPKVYRWRWSGGVPTLEYVGTLSSSGNDRFIWRYAVGNNERTMIERVSPDGEHLLVDSLAQLDPAADQDSTRDVYRWSAGGGWQCLSCQVLGVASAGGSNVWGMSVPEVPDKTLNIGLQDGVTHNSDPIRVASEDGKRIFFTSMDKLADADKNNAQDVYEWEEGEGLSLISGGQGGTISKLVGTSTSGDDVFFVTADQLVGWDIDGLRDIYDARVEGGFPEPSPPPDICASGEECHEGGTVAPSGGPPVTPGFNGAPDPTPTTHCRKGFELKTNKSGNTFCKKKPKKHKQHKKKAKKGKRRGGKGK